MDKSTSSNLPEAGSRSPRFSAWQRRAILLLFSLFLSLIVLGLLEGSLRLAGYGGYGSTFVKAGKLPDGSSLFFTDHAGPASYFFANRSRAGSLDRDALLMPKPQGTFRVFLVGGSAAKGNPYARPLTGASFLREMLSDLWPEREIEVINLGTTAVASYPALGMMTEALEYDPDLIVAYTGNNEFYGAYGVASMHTAGRSPAMIRLIRSTRSTAIAQLFDDVLRPATTPNSSTLMEAMIGRASVAPDAPERSARRTQPRSVRRRDGPALPRPRRADRRLHSAVQRARPRPARNAIQRGRADRDQDRGGKAPARR